MQYDERFGAIECILFVSGDPVPMVQLQRALGTTQIEFEYLLRAMDELYRSEKRGVQLYMTGDTVQLVSNREYASLVQELLQPVQDKSFSQAMLETLSVVAYRQPVTRTDIENVRGVRCEYAVSQLLKIGMIQELGRKNVIGRPMLFGTTDAFLRHFGLHDIAELPPLSGLPDEDMPSLAQMEEETEAVEQSAS